MNPEDQDTTIADIHSARAQIAAKFGGDLFAINADARERMKQSGRSIIRRTSPPPTSPQPIQKVDPAK